MTTAPHGRTTVAVPFVRRVKGHDAHYRDDGGIREIKQYDGTATTTLDADLPFVRFEERTSVRLPGGTEVGYAWLDGHLHVEAPWQVRARAHGSDKRSLDTQDDFSVPQAASVGFGGRATRTPGTVTYDDGAMRAARVRTVLVNAVVDGDGVWLRTFGAWPGAGYFDPWLGFDVIGLQDFRHKVRGMLEADALAPRPEGWDPRIVLPKRLAHLLDAVTRVRSIALPDVKSYQSDTGPYPDLECLAEFSRRLRDLDAAMSACDERKVASTASGALDALREHARTALESFRGASGGPTHGATMDRVADGLVGYWTSADLPPPRDPGEALDALTFTP